MQAASLRNTATLHRNDMFNTDNQSALADPAHLAAFHEYVVAHSRVSTNTVKQEYVRGMSADRDEKQQMAHACLNEAYSALSPYNQWRRLPPMHVGVSLGHVGTGPIALIVVLNWPCFNPRNGFATTLSAVGEGGTIQGYTPAAIMGTKGLFATISSEALGKECGVRAHPPPPLACGRLLSAAGASS